MRGTLRRQLLLLGGIAAGVLAYRFVAVPLLHKLGAKDLARPVDAPDKGDRFRVVSWNIQNFTKPRATPQMAAALAALDADLLAFQEVRNPAALQAILPGKTVVASEHGGRGGQSLAIAFDPERVQVLDGPHQLTSLEMGGSVRPGYAVQVRVLPDGPDFHLVTVHLKAMAKGYEVRQQQWTRLNTELQRILGAQEKDIILLGDFNTTGSADGSSAAEVSALEQALGAVGLRRLALEPGCTAYWDGPNRDAMKQPSALDHIFVGDLRESLDPNTTAQPLSHCAQHRCDPLRSTQSYPEAGYALSDHCPVVLDLRPADDD